VHLNNTIVPLHFEFFCDAIVKYIKKISNI